MFSMIKIQIRNFLNNNFFPNIGIGPTTTRVGAITYNDQVVGNETFPFATYTSLSTVQVGFYS